MKRFLVPLAIFAVVAAFLAVGLTRNPREVPSPLIGRQHPRSACPSTPLTPLVLSVLYRLFHRDHKVTA